MSDLTDFKWSFSQGYFILKSETASQKALFCKFIIIYHRHRFQQMGLWAFSCVHKIVQRPFKNSLTIFLTILSIFGHHLNSCNVGCYYLTGPASRFSAVAAFREQRTAAMLQKQTCPRSSGQSHNVHYKTRWELVLTGGNVQDGVSVGGKTTQFPSRTHASKTRTGLLTDYTSSFTLYSVPFTHILSCSYGCSFIFFPKQTSTSPGCFTCS